jgi:hypothetical protein
MSGTLILIAGTQARSWSDRGDHGRNANRDQGQKKPERVSARPLLLVSREQRLPLVARAQ